MRRRQLVRAIGAFGATLLLSPTAIAEPSKADALGRGRYAKLHVFLEKTLFQVDVLSLEIRVDQPTADALEQALRGQEHTAALERKIVSIVLATKSAAAGLNFLRPFSREDLVAGVRADVKRAYDGKLIDRAEYLRVYRGMPAWFAFLGERGVRAGDWLLHRGGPNGLRTVYRDEGGKILIDRTTPGRAPTRTLLASFLCPGGELREPLVASLFQ